MSIKTILSFDSFPVDPQSEADAAHAREHAITIVRALLERAATVPIVASTLQIDAPVQMFAFQARAAFALLHPEAEVTFVKPNKSR
jgi:hypothetical protein